MRRPWRRGAILMLCMLPLAACEDGDVPEGGTPDNDVVVEITLSPQGPTYDRGDSISVAVSVSVDGEPRAGAEVSLRATPDNVIFTPSAMPITSALGIASAVINTNSNTINFTLVATVTGGLTGTDSRIITMNAP